MHFCGLGMLRHVTAAISLALPTFLQVPGNSAQSAQTLFPRAGDTIHPELRNRGLVYETNYSRDIANLPLCVVDPGNFAILSCVTKYNIGISPYTQKKSKKKSRL